ncbi:MAG: YqgE/AlgH family protein [Salinisphaera sp.]|nr:YqgE/AlgH family protein [Salinisphaera sp.]
MLLAAAGLAWYSLSAISQPPAAPHANPSLRGTLLVAAPGSIGPFAHTVVLIIDHGRDGTLGLVLNLPTKHTLRDALPEQLQHAQQDYRLFSGGPMQQGQLSLLLRSGQDEIPEQMIQVTDELRYTRLTSSFDHIIATAPPRKSIRVFVGYCGWGPGQLAREIRQGAWLLTDADAEAILAADPATLWQRMLEHIQGNTAPAPHGQSSQGVI